MTVFTIDPDDVDTYNLKYTTTASDLSTKVYYITLTISPACLV